MAKEIQPVSKRYPTLVSEGGVLHQKPYKEVGITPINFGAKTITNTIPGASAEKYSQGERKRIVPHIGRQFDQIAQNTRALMDHAKSQGKIEEWSTFYHDAHDFAHKISQQLGIPHLHASGFVAALSGGGGEWETNKANAVKLAHHIKHGIPITHKDLAGVESSRVDNAVKIYRGASPRDVLGEAKEGNFAENIHDPLSDNHLTIDTHNFHGMTGWKRPWRGPGGGTPGMQDPRNYRTLAGIVKEVSQEHGLAPAAGQSVTWWSNKSVMPRVSGTVPPQHPNFQNYYPISPENLPARYRK